MFCKCISSSSKQQKQSFIGLSCSRLSISTINLFLFVYCLWACSTMPNICWNDARGFCAAHGNRFALSCRYVCVSVCINETNFATETFVLILTWCKAREIICIHAMCVWRYEGVSEMLGQWKKTCNTCAFDLTYPGHGSMKIEIPYDFQVKTIRRRTCNTFKVFEQWTKQSWNTVS